MTDARKFRLAVVLGVFLCALAVAYNIAGEYLLPDIEAYIERRLYYERVISKKGLSLHPAEYWKEKGD